MKTVCWVTFLEYSAGKKKQVELTVKRLHAGSHVIHGPSQ